MHLNKNSATLIFLLIVGGIFPAFSQTTDKAKLIEFEDAITKGEEYLQAKDYAKAKAEYQKALAIDPSAKFPKDKLAQIRKVYTDPKDEADFQNAVSKGDQLMTKEDYRGAKDQYNSALLIKPDDKAVKAKLANADKAFNENNQKLALYTAMIRKADSLYNLKEYETALETYKQAQTLEAPTARIREIESMLAEKKALEDSYTSAINAGDEAYMSREFATAKTEYEKALKIKPSEGYPKSMLEKVQEAMAKQATEEVSQSEMAARKRAEEEKQQAALAEQNRIAQEEKLKEEQAAKERLALEAKEKADSEERDRLALIEKAEQDRLALEAQQNAEKEKQDKLKEEQDRLLREKSTQDSLKYAEQMRISEQERLDSIDMANATAAKIEEERLAEARNREEEKAIEARQAEEEKVIEDRNAEENKIAEAKRQEEIRLAEARKAEEIEAHKVMLENASDNDRQYYAAIESGNTLYTLQDYPSALRMFEIAAELKPGEEYPRDKLITISNIMKERLKNNLDPYYKIISAADVSFQANMFDRALEQYQNASANRPEENYPVMMIERIRKLMEDNSMVNLSEEPVIFNDNEEKRYTFKALDLKFRRNSYLILRAKYTSEKPPKLFINYGKDGHKSGGFVIKMQEGANATDYLLRLSNQDKWYRLDNNWITFYPEGGSIEVESLRISQGDVSVIK